MLAQIGSGWPVVAAGGKAFGIQTRGLVEHVSKKRSSGKPEPLPFALRKSRSFQRAQGLLWLVMSLRRLADQALKRLQRLLGKPVVEFADLLRLGH
ncbi:hypothetical protein V1292_003983 [Bradyrhizobium sp. AZCC 1719]